MIRYLMIATLLCAGLCARTAWAQPDCNDWNSVSFFEGATAADVKRCLAAGADVNARAEAGMTPLHAAAAVGNAETVAALVKAGANIRAKTSDGRLPADLAEDNDKVKNHDIFWTLNAARYE